MSDRTVLDVAAAVTPPHNAHLGVHPYDALKALGVDPDMPFEQFSRWLRYGQRADEMERALTDEQSHAWTWNACLDAIKGGS